MEISIVISLKAFNTHFDDISINYTTQISKNAKKKRNEKPFFFSPSDFESFLLLFVFKTKSQKCLSILLSEKQQQNDHFVKNL